MVSDAHPGLVDVIASTLPGPRGNGTRAHMQEGTLARSLLSQAIDDADPDARHVVEIPDGIPRRSIARSKGSNGC